MKKIYFCLTNATVKTHFSSDKKPKVVERTLNHLALIEWPNGKPCFLVNEWLVHIGKKSTGNTVGTYASQVSFVVRFCYEKKIGFFDLTDDHIYEFRDELVGEIKNTGERKRNNNTVRDILDRTITFLAWAQNNTINDLPLNHFLVGEAHTCPSITVQKSKNKKTGRNYYNHDSMPPEEVPESVKLPITDYAIDCLKNSINIDLHRDADDKQRSYMYERRMFCLWMLQRFGVRPSELTNYSVLSNSDFMKIKRIALPTMKRRRLIPVSRTIPISSSDALRIGRYMDARTEYLINCPTELVNGLTDTLLITVGHTKLTAPTLTKDFYRLKTKAGLHDQRICMSMFRHRFITREVLTALKEFMASHNLSRDLMTEGAIFSILKRISTKTGHSDPMSLMPYVSIAWAAMDIWQTIDNAIEALHVADHIMSDLNEMYHIMASKKFENIENSIDFAKELLSEFIRRGILHTKE